MTTWRESRWPKREPAAPQILIATALAAGLAAASTIPLDRPAVGWLIGAVAIAVALVVMARGTAGHVRLPWLVMATALMAVGTIRASYWLFTLCVITAIVATALSLTTTRHAVLLPVAAIRALPWVAKGLRRIRTGSDASRLAIPIAVSAILLLVFGPLLTSGDALFADLLGGLTPDVSADSVAQWIWLFVLVTGGSLAAAFLLANPVRADDTPRERTPVRLTDWAIPVGVLVALFAAFVGVRLTALFGGREHVLRTAGLTAAEYARSGFWQLSAVTALTLVVIGVAARLAPTGTARERLWLRGLLGSLAVLTLVIAVSALTRLWAYQEAFGFTVLRLLVGCCEVWMILVYVMVLVAGVRLRARWLPSAILGTAMALLVGLAVLDPERFIADRNIARYADTGELDRAYLANLSADVVPAITALPDADRRCLLARHAARLPDDGALTWNLARSRARSLLVDAAHRACPGY